MKLLIWHNFYLIYNDKMVFNTQYILFLIFHSIIQKRRFLFSIIFFIFLSFCLFIKGKIHSFFMLSFLLPFYHQNIDQSKPSQNLITGLKRKPKPSLLYKNIGLGSGLRIYGPTYYYSLKSKSLLMFMIVGITIRILGSYKQPYDSTSPKCLIKNIFL